MRQGLGPFREHRFHDFRRARHIGEEEVKALETLHRKFARAASEGLSALVRGRVDVTFTGVSQRSYSEFIGSVSSPTSLHLVYCLPQGLPFVLELSPSVLFPMLVRLVGGPDDGASQPASSPTLSLQPVRPFTRIEQALVGSITSRVLDALRETWAPRLPDVRFDVAESEHNPLLMQVVGPSEPSVVLACEVSVGQNAGRTHISLPARSFKGVLDILTRSGVRSGSQAGGNTETERQRIRDHLSQAEITMVAEFDPLPLELSDVLALRPGDIIDTEIRRGAEVSVLVEGKRLFRGVPVSLDGRRAIQLRGDEPRPPS